MPTIKPVVALAKFICVEPVEAVPVVTFEAVQDAAKVGST